MPPSSITLETLAPRRDSVSKLLLLLSRPELTQCQQQEVRRLASQVLDWDEFAQLATRKFVVTFARRHLRSCAADIVPTPAMARMQALAKKTAMSILRVAAAQAAFHKACIESTSASHAYLKGLALASLYTRDIGERYCRDIDVLVHPRVFREVLQAAISSGYEVFIDDLPGQPISKAQDIDFLCRHADVVSLVGKDLIPIEVHKRLDKRHVRFDSDLALATAETVRLPGMLAKTLSRPLHFNYLCYHHARHFWSHLHWVVDLNAFALSPDIDRNEVRQIAEKVGIRPTIDGALEFSELTGRAELWDDALSNSSSGGQFLRACLINLNGGIELEEELRKQRPSGDMMAAWQIAPDRRLEFFFNSLSRRLRPRPLQYFGNRWPPWLHWVYVLQNAFLVVRSAAAACKLALGFVGSSARRAKHAVDAK